MSKHVLPLVVVLGLTVASLDAQQAPAARPGPLPSIDERTAGLRKIDGFIPLYWDERSGAMLLEVGRFDAEMLMSTGLSAGLGSNDLGLDRGQGGQGRIVTFQRVGPRVLLVQPNQSFRSSSPNVLERQAVEDSFAKSGTVGLHGGRRVGRPRPGRRHRLLPARRPRRGWRAAARHLPRRSLAQHVLPAQHQGLPEEHRSGPAADVRQRRGRPARRGRSGPGSGADRRHRRRWWRRRRVRRQSVQRHRGQRRAERRCGHPA